MNHDQKMAFIANMTDKGLQHIAANPQSGAPGASPTSGWTHEKMLGFIAAMTKHGLQHLDAGGTVLTGPTTPGLAANTTSGGIAAPIADVFGTNNSFQAAGAPIQAGTNVGQLNNAYTGAQNAINTQAGITNTLNQGLNQGANTQNNLTNMLTAEAHGQGPNPAQNALNQNTAQNIAQQAALAAGQRGAGANAGLIARQNAQQGAATQQQAVGQAATLGAEQELAAQNNLQNLAGTQVAQGQAATQGLSNAQQNEQNILEGANTAFNNAAVGMQSNVNNVNAGISTANQNNASNIDSGVLGALTGSSLVGSIFAEGGPVVKMDKGGKVLDAAARKHIAPHNFALPGGRYPIHDIAHARNALARVSQNGTPAEQAKVRAAVHRKYPSIGKATGGQVKGYAGGGVIGQPTSGPQSFVGQWLNSNVSSGGGPNIQPTNINTQIASPFSSMNSKGTPKSDEFANVNPIVGTGAAEAPGSQMIAGGQGEGAGGGLLDDITGEGGGGGLGVLALAAYDGGLMKKGGKVMAKDPSEKAVKSGDSIKNDKIPAMLSEGEFVIDRDTMNDRGPIGQMARALAMHIQKRNKK